MNLRLNVELSQKAPLQSVFHGSLELLGMKTAALDSIVNGRSIKYKVNFPLQDTIPKLIKILYNDQLICSGNLEPGNVTTVKLEHTLGTQSSESSSGDTHSNGELSIEMSTTTSTGTTVKPTKKESLDDLLTQLYGSDSEFVQTSSSSPITTTTTESIIKEDNRVCGKPIPSGNPLVLDGNPTIRGEFPWLVAIYVKKTKNLVFHCGATLVSSKTILTAAHCIHLPTDDILSENEIVLFAGRHNIDDWNESSYISLIIKKIVVHPQYDPPGADADIALITLKKRIKYTQFIRPACLWKGNIMINEIVSHDGTVAGWGRDKEGIITSIPNKVEMPIVSESACLRSHESYRFLTSNRTFCAGKRDGSGPCNGDSGGGFTMYRNGRWYLRGLVSNSLHDANTNSCDARNYFVFTDVAQFLPWINSYL